MFWPFATARRFRSLLRRAWTSRRRLSRSRQRLGIAAITVDAVERDGGWAHCQLEPLEQRKVLDADFSIVGTTLTITLDDTDQAIAFAPTSAAGNYTFSLAGAATNVFNGTDGGGLVGNGTNTLTVNSSAVIDAIVVNTNASITSGGFSFGNAGSNQTVDALTIAVDGNITVANSVLTTANLSFDRAGNVSVTSGVAVTNGTLLINGSGIAGETQLGANLTATGTGRIVTGAVSLTADVVVGGGQEAVLGAVTGGNHNLTLSGGGTAALTDGATNLATLTTDADVSLNGTIGTNGDQVYNANVVLTGDTTLQGSNVSFAAGLAGGNNSLTLNFTGVAPVVDSSFANIATLTTDGDVALNGTVQTNVDQVYNSNVAVIGDTTLQGNAATFAFGANANNNSLILNFTGAPTQLDFADVKTLTAESDVTVSGLFQTNLDQIYNGNLTLVGFTDLAGNAATFSAGVIGQNQPLSLNFTGAATAIDGGFTNVAILTAETPVTLNGTVKTNGWQTYNATATLVGDTTLEGSNVSFAGVVTGGSNNLAVNLSAPAGVRFAGNVALGVLTANAGSYDVALTGTNNSLAGISLQNTGNVSIGDAATDLLTVSGPVDTQAANATFLGGGLRTAGGNVTLGATTLVANSTIDTTANGVVPAGAPIVLAGGVTLGGFLLDTVAGTSATELRGDSTISGGQFVISSGSLNLGSVSTSANLTATDNTTILVASGGINVFANSTITALGKTLTLQADALSVDPGAGNITAATISLLPATANLNISLGTANRPGLVVNQSAFDHLNTSDLRVGTAGFNGTIDIGNLAVPQGQLQIIADGSGAEVFINGNLAINTTASPTGISLLIEGAGATTYLNGTITSANDVVINDSLQVNGGSHAINTSASNANITITGGNANGSAGIYATKGETNSLSLLAGTGTVTLGGTAGFGDNAGNGSFIQDLSIAAGNTVLADASNQFGGNLSVAGNLTVGGALTTGGDLSVNATTLSAATTFTSTGGNISVAAGLNGDETLAVLAANGTVQFGAIGTTTPVAGIDLRAATAVVFGGAMSIDGTNGTGIGLRVGPGVNNVNLAQPGSTISNSTVFSVRIASGSTNTTLSGLAIAPSAGSGVSFGAGDYSGSSLENTLIDGGNTAIYGLFLDGAENLAVGGTGPNQSVGVTAARFGIFARGNLTGTTIRGTAVANGTSALQLESARGLTVDGNNSLASATAGVTVSGDSTGTVVANNTIGAANQTFGVLFANAQNVTATNNTIGGTTFGLYGAGELAGSVFGGNRISNISVGVLLQNGDNLTVNGNNSITGAALYGLYAAGGSDGVAFANNTIDGAGLTTVYGVFVDGPQTITVGGAAQGNRITGAQYGLFARGGATGVNMAFNTVANGTTGAQFNGAGNLTLVGNNLTGTAAALIVTGSSDGAVVQNNTLGEVSGSQKNLVLVSGATGLTLGGTGTGQGNTMRAGARGLTLTGNLAGTTVAGNSFENATTGIALSAASNVTVNGNNTINGGTTGMLIAGASDGSVVQNNTIAGTGMSFGVSIISATGLTFGGVATGQGTSIDGAATGLFASGNLAGTTIAGVSAINGTNGIQLSSASNLTLVGNTLTNNKSAGLYAVGDNSGTVASNSTLSNNSFGAYIAGANLSLQGNTIANNSQHGVLISGASALNNPLLSNSIAGNGGFGIRLVNGGNGNQRAPYVAASTLSGGNLTVLGGLSAAAANSTYLIQLFSNPVGPLAQAQGRTFLQNVTLVTDATGNGTFNETFSQGSVVPGELISATATLNQTSPTNTSQFSAGSNVT